MGQPAGDLTLINCLLVSDGAQEWAGGCKLSGTDVEGGPTPITSHCGVPSHDWHQCLSSHHGSFYYPRPNTGPTVLIPRCLQFPRQPAKINLGLRPGEDPRPLFYYAFSPVFQRWAKKQRLLRPVGQQRKQRDKHYLWMTDFKVNDLPHWIAPSAPQWGLCHQIKKRLFNPLTLLCPFVVKWSFHQFRGTLWPESFLAWVIQRRRDREGYFSTPFFLKWRLINYAKKLRHNDPATVTKPN